MWVYHTWYFTIFTNFIQKIVLFLCYSLGYYAVQGGSKVLVCGWNPKVRPYKVVLAFELVDEILRCDHSFIHFSESVQGGSNFCVCGWNHKGWPFKWKLPSCSFLWHRLLFVHERSIVAIQLKTTDPLYPSQVIFYVSIHNCFSCESKIASYTRFV